MNVSGFVATLGVAVLVLSACGSEKAQTPPEVTNTSDAPSTAGSETGSSALVSSVSESTSLVATSESTNATSNPTTESVSTDTSNTGTGTTDASNTGASANDTSFASDSSAANTSSTSTTQDSAVETATATETTSDVTTSGETLVLSSPSLDGAPDCSTANPAACDTFLNENISYMGNANISPQLDWSGVPAGTQSFAVTLRDVTFGQPLWAIWNIPATESGLPADLAKDTAILTTPAGAEQSSATFADGDGYFGPEAGCNVFQFDLFALSLPTFEPAYKEYAAEVDAQLNQLGDAILGRASLAGRTKYDMMCE